MRRSRTALTAWPAFADLMTILAVVGLAIAAGLAGGGDDVDALNVSLEERADDLERQLAAARERNAEAEARIRALEEQLAVAREPNAALLARIDALDEQLAAARDREVERRLGSFPCLGTLPGSQTAPVPLLRIVVDAGYRLTPLWPPDADVDGIPRLDEAVAHGRMQEADLQGYARGIHAYGNAADTYGRPCRFWVELRKGETTPQTAFARALGIVNQYFLLSNSSEVNRLLVGP